MTDTPSVEFPDYPFRGKSIIDREPLFDNAQVIEKEEVIKKLKRLEKLARRYSNVVYKKTDTYSKKNPKTEICGLLSEDGVNFAEDKYYGTQAQDFLPDEEIRELANKDTYVFHTHPAGSEQGLSGQDIFSAYISLGEVIFTEPKQGQKIALLVCPLENIPIEKINEARQVFWDESANVSSYWGHFQHDVFGQLAKDKLKIRIKEIDLSA